MIVVISADAKFRIMCAEIFANDRHITAVTAAELSGAYTVRKSDIVVLDIKYLTETDIRMFPCPVAALSPVPSISEAAQMIRLGVRGYGNRMMKPENLKLMLRTLILGQLWMPPEILNQLINMIPGNAAQDNQTAAGLSDREREVAELVALGKSNQEISDSLNISVRTVKAHLTSIFSKTGIRDRLGLALSFKK